jgi:hypothetical protein
MGMHCRDAMDTLKLLERKLKTAAFSANATFDLQWWNKGATALERAAILLSLELNGFTAAGLRPGALDVGVRVVFARPAMWQLVPLLTSQPLATCSDEAAEIAVNAPASRVRGAGKTVSAATSDAGQGGAVAPHGAGHSVSTALNGAESGASTAPSAAEESHHCRGSGCSFMTCEWLDSNGVTADTADLGVRSDLKCAVKGGDDGDVMLLQFDAEETKSSMWWSEQKRSKTKVDISCRVQACASGHVCVQPVRVIATRQEVGYHRNRKQWFVHMIEVQFIVQHQEQSVHSTLFRQPKLPWEVAWNVQQEVSRRKGEWVFKFAPTINVAGSGGSVGEISFNLPRQVIVPANSKIVQRQVLEPDEEAGTSLHHGRICVHRDWQCSFVPHATLKWHTLDSRTLQGEQNAYGHEPDSSLSFRVKAEQQQNLRLLVSVAVHAIGVKTRKVMEVENISTEPVVKLWGAVKLIK